MASLELVFDETQEGPQGQKATLLEETQKGCREGAAVLRRSLGAL